MIPGVASWGLCLSGGATSGVASITLGPIQLDRPEWLLLLIPLVVLVLWIGRRSIAGLGGASRWVALSIRLIVTALLVIVLAEPSWQRRSRDVAVTLVLDTSRSMPQEVQSLARSWVAESAGQHQRPADRLGFVTAARDAYIQQLPRVHNRIPETTTSIGATDGTNLAQAVQLALAVMPRTAANRMVLISDGNETAGSLLQAAEAARAANVPIDVAPARFRHASEVIVDRLIVPATARLGETVNVRIFITATRPTSGRLTLLRNGEPVDLDPGSPGTGMRIDLAQGLNPLTIPIADAGGGRQEFRAVFEPRIEGGVALGDSILENNTAIGVTFVAGRGRVLVISRDTVEAGELLSVLRSARIDATFRNAAESFTDLGELTGYDAVILANESAYNFSHGQQEELRRYVHDTGGGLVMVGGPESFGAGGWIGSPLEDAMPVRLDPPQRRQMPRGALVMVIHSVEFPNGPYWGKQVSQAAADALSRDDLAGIVEVDWQAAPRWVHRLQPIGDRTVITRAINALQFGDMQDFAPSIRLAYQALASADAGQKHMIIVSDGDPSPPTAALLQQMVAANISISTVALGVHSAADAQRLGLLATATNGRHYEVTPGTLATLPQIFVKEAQTIRRSMIWEGTPFAPTVTGAGSEPMRGIAAAPPIGGYVIAADREGLSMVTMRGGSENDPIAAHWQYGLGRSVAYLSDATRRWGASWVGWDEFQRFWEQHIRWAMRPSGSAEVRVGTENRGDRTIVTVETSTPDGEPLNFAAFNARVARPDQESRDVVLRQVAPGRYQGEFDSSVPGSYVLGMTYSAPGPDGRMIEGSAQAAVNRPFADEFRALEDNAPLLLQVAAMTGGRVLDLGPGGVPNLWDRAGLDMPVATRSIWLALALLAVGLFLVDVAVRRVRIDVVGMFRVLVAGLRGGVAATDRQMGSLHEARRKAREGMRERGAGTGVDAGPSVSTDPAVARRKFEATPEQARSAGPVSLTPDQLAPGGTKDRAQPRPAAPPPKTQTPDEGISRLLKAKQRAREEMRDDPNNAGPS